MCTLPAFRMHMNAHVETSSLPWPKATSGCARAQTKSSSNCEETGLTARIMAALIRRRKSDGHSNAWALHCASWIPPRDAVRRNALKAEEIIVT